MNVSLFWLLYYLTLRARPNVCLTKENHLKFYSHTWDSLLSLSSHNINPGFSPLWPSLTKALYQRHLLLCSKSAPHRHIPGLFNVPVLDQSSGGFFQARSLSLQRLFPRDDVSCFDSSGSSEGTGAASQDLSGPGPRHHRTTVSPQLLPNAFVSQMWTPVCGREGWWENVLSHVRYVI